MPHRHADRLFPQVVFVDVVDKLINDLQNTKSYTVTEIGREGEKVNTISNYRAINSKTNEADAIKEITEADLVRLLPFGPFSPPLPIVLLC